MNVTAEETFDKILTASLESKFILLFINICLFLLVFGLLQISTQFYNSY